ncbi:hypothetical protein C0J52_05995 [Blattella germanica]|nr:hypothetical protein C0J52_05995 [Blattella germanica]
MRYTRAKLSAPGKQLFETALLTVSAEDWKNACDHVEKYERFIVSVSIKLYFSSFYTRRCHKSICAYQTDSPLPTVIKPRWQQLMVVVQGGNFHQWHGRGGGGQEKASTKTKLKKRVLGQRGKGIRVCGNAVSISPAGSRNVNHNRGSNSSAQANNHDIPGSHPGSGHSN